MLHLKGLCCARIAHISMLTAGVDGHRRGQELAAIVPGSYSTREIGTAQEDSGAGAAKVESAFDLECDHLAES